MFDKLYEIVNLRLQVKILFNMTIYNLATLAKVISKCQIR